MGLPIAAMCLGVTVVEMSITFLGLDAEMSDSELSKGAVIVQIGAAASPTDVFCEVIGWPIGSYHKTSRAMAVHGISEEEIAQAPPPAEVDARFWDWLCHHGASVDKKAVVPVGFNVNGFDLPFVRAYLPKSYALLSRRVVDLNGLLYTFAECMPYEGSRPTSSGWKRIAKRYAAEALANAGVAPKWHDAGYDAAAALLVREFFRGLISGRSGISSPS